MEPLRIDLVELDIDTRLVNLWCEANAVDEWNLTVAAAFMRAAYGVGYCDSLRETNHGQLLTEHGYTVPTRG